MKYGGPSEILILSSVIGEKFVVESSHETMLCCLRVLDLATTAPLSSGALHAKHAVQPKLIYGHILALVLMLSLSLPAFFFCLNLSSAMVTRTSHGFLGDTSLQAAWHFQLCPVYTGNVSPVCCRI